MEAYAREGGPFFLYVAFNAPHAPYMAPDEAIADYIDLQELEKLSKKEQNAWVYRAMVSRMDKGIGEILDSLEDAGLTDDTLVIFVSDNGGVEGLTGGSTCAPLKGHKFQEWDGGVRVPALVRWPRHFPGGRKIDQVTAFVDLMPTLAQLVGDRKKTDRPYDGISVLKLLDGRKKTLKRDLYLGCGAVVNRDGKYIRAGKNRAMGLREDWYSAYKDDPYESENVLDAHAKEAGRLKKIADEYDAIIPYVPEQEFGKGQKGFKAPKEWRVTLP